MRRRFRSGWKRAKSFTPSKLGFLEWCASKSLYLWSKQKLVGEAVELAKRVICLGGHQWGKTRLAALLALWWIDTHPRSDTCVIIVAPDWDQITDGILREIDVIRRDLRMPGKINLNKQYAGWTIGENKVIACRSPQQGKEISQTKTGFHRRYLLVILEEGCGLDRNTWRNAESWALNPAAKLFSPGNPLDQETAFGDCAAEGSGWEVFTVATTDSPAFTDEYAPDEVIESLAGPEAVEQWP